MLYQLHSFVFILVFAVNFFPFVCLSSFNPENGKYTKKGVFSNISTKKSCFYTLFYIIYMLHLVHIKYPHT
ncbi:hypothetical protein Hanom_Chr16g01476391 [Helianthus anomalus]